jgi:hypothetical protein
MHRQSHWLLVAALLVPTRAGGTDSVPVEMLRPKIVVTVDLKYEPTLRGRFESELLEKPGQLKPEEYLAKEVVETLEESLPVFEFVTAANDGAVAVLSVVLEPSVEVSLDPKRRNEAPRPWPGAEAGMSLKLQLGEGAPTRILPRPVAVFPAEIDTELHLTQVAFLRPVIAELLGSWPNGLRSAITSIPFAISAEATPTGADTKATYQQLLLRSNMAIFCAPIDAAGRSECFRACSEKTLGGPLVDSSDESTCKTLLADGAKRPPKRNWRSKKIFLERFWNIPPN